MLKTINAVQVRARFGQLIEEVHYKQDEYLIQRAGRPMAVLIPVEEFERMKRSREERFAVYTELKNRVSKTPAKALSKTIDEAVEWARKAR